MNRWIPNVCQYKISYFCNVDSFFNNTNKKVFYFFHYNRVKVEKYVAFLNMRKSEIIQTVLNMVLIQMLI